MLQEPSCFERESFGFVFWLWSSKARRTRVDHKKERMYAKLPGRNLYRRAGGGGGGQQEPLSPGHDGAPAGDEWPEPHESGGGRRELGLVNLVLSGLATMAGELVVLQHGAQATSGLCLHHSQDGGEGGVAGPHDRR